MALSPESRSSSSSLETASSLTTEDLAYLLASSPAVWLEMLTELDGRPLRLEPYQIRFLNDRSPARVVNKSRQIGFSTVIAAEALHKAATTPAFKANFISINQTEAADKIQIARTLYHSIPEELSTTEPPLRPSLYANSEMELSFHLPPNVSELISQPASAAIRGGKKDIYFDEFAHVRDSKKLYQAALPAITRGDGRISVISTPLGQSGLFYDICTKTDDYPEYSRHAVPWWECGIMCMSPEHQAEAMARWGEMDTRTRVELWGSPKIKMIFKSFGTDVQGFSTEYEATFVDELSSYYPWSLIVDAVEDDEFKEWSQGSHIPIGWSDPKGEISIGVDLAKERDESVFTVVETIGEGEDAQRYPRYIYATQDPYEKQWATLEKLIGRVKARRVTIDQTGVGNVFIEKARASKFSGVIEGVVFTNKNKEEWATRLKGDFQLGNVHLPRHGELMRQIHNVQRIKTEAGFYKFSGKPRDDYFWSLCLALYGEGRTPVRISFL